MYNNDALHGIQFENKRLGRYLFNQSVKPVYEVSKQSWYKKHKNTCAAQVALQYGCLENAVANINKLG